MNRQTKRLLAKQEQKAERDRARAAGAGRGNGGGGGGKTAVGGEGRGGRSPKGPSTGEREGRFRRMARFIREVRQELKKVAWPTRGEVITYTVVVLVSVTFVALLVFGLDWVFGEGSFELYST